MLEPLLQLLLLAPLGLLQGLEAFLLVLLHPPRHLVHRHLAHLAPRHLAAHHVLEAVEVAVGNLLHHLAHLVELLDHPVDLNDRPAGPGR